MLNHATILIIRSTTFIDFESAKWCNSAWHCRQRRSVLRNGHTVIASLSLLLALKLNASPNVPRMAFRPFSLAIFCHAVPCKRNPQFNGQSTCEFSASFDVTMPIPTLLHKWISGAVKFRTKKRTHPEIVHLERGQLTSNDYLDNARQQMHKKNNLESFICLHLNGKMPEKNKQNTREMLSFQIFAVYFFAQRARIK